MDTALPCPSSTNTTLTLIPSRRATASFFRAIFFLKRKYLLSVKNLALVIAVQVPPMSSQCPKNSVSPVWHSSPHLMSPVPLNALPAGKKQRPSLPQHIYPLNTPCVASLSTKLYIRLPPSVSSSLLTLPLFLSSKVFHF